MIVGLVNCTNLGTIYDISTCCCKSWSHTEILARIFKSHVAAQKHEVHACWILRIRPQSKDNVAQSITSTATIILNIFNNVGESKRPLGVRSNWKNLQAGFPGGPFGGSIHSKIWLLPPSLEKCTHFTCSLSSVLPLILQVLQQLPTPKS